MNAAVNTAITTVETLTPAILAALAASDPKLAAILEALPVIAQLAGVLQKAGADTPEQLAALFGQIGQGVSATHAQWIAQQAGQQPKAAAV